MPGDATRLRRDLTPCILHTDLTALGGGLPTGRARAGKVYARHVEDVLVLTIGFNPRLDPVVAELQERGTLDERVVVRNFFRDSAWVRSLGAPPAEALAEALRARGGAGAAADARRPGLPHRRPAGRRAAPVPLPLLRPRGAPGPHDVGGAGREEFRGAGAASRAGFVALRLEHAGCSQWVDQELAGRPRPVLFSLQRGLVDPVLLATTTPSRKVVSLHNCHYRDPQDPTSGLRAIFRPVLEGPRRVDEVVCLTHQQRAELEVDAPRAMIRSINYPAARAPRHPADKLVVMVARLEPRKRVDHALRAFVHVLAAVPDARTEVYGAGVEGAATQALVDELGLGSSVRLMGYSLEAGAAMSRALCTILTSTFEGNSRVVSESMSRGTPVVTYDIRYGPRDLVRDGVDGVLVTRHEPDALAEALVGLLQDPQRGSTLGVRAREVIDQYPVADSDVPGSTSSTAAADRCASSWPTSRRRRTRTPPRRRRGARRAGRRQSGSSTRRRKCASGPRGR